MRFEESKSFMSSVEQGDIFGIKSDLESLIAITKGNKAECLRAIEYARKNSDFDWEEDDGVFFGEGLVEDDDIYLYEKGRLVQNFTKERFDKVIELYNKLYPAKKEKNGGVVNETPFSPEKTGTNKGTSKSKTIQSDKRMDNNKKRIALSLFFYYWVNTCFLLIFSKSFESDNTRYFSK